MERTFDLVIRNGTVVDGSGRPPYQADVAISGGFIAEVGDVPGSGVEEIDAAGMLVTPGFVDIHTHYDAQVTWADRLAPSTAHGVTTVVIGNCGVGFAPCRPGDQDALIKLMEGVEDIPGVVMAEGIPWEWETFPQFLDFLETRSYDADVAAYLPHAPLRVYAMGQRGLDREPATTADMQRMVDLATEAMDAGAIGIATSRSLNHRSSDHHLLPGVSAAEGELKAISAGIKRGAGDGVLQLIADFDEPASDFAMLRRIGENTGLPIMFSLMQNPAAPTRWRHLLDMVESANDDGVKIQAQVFPRPVGSIVGLRLHYNMFSFSPAYVAIADLPLQERLARLRDPEVRRQITSQYPTVTLEPASGAFTKLESFYLMDATPNYEPDASQSIANMARAAGVEPVDLAYDLLIENDGSNIFYAPVMNYVDGNLDAVSEMVRHEHTLIGLGDGGAHVGIICDASGQTYMLRRWAGKEEGQMPIENVVQALTSANACAVNLQDRGLIAVGYRADLNVIDFDGLELHRPEMVHDLPLGGGRLIQRAEGYRATIVNGQVTYRDGEPTGSLPGRLVRGSRGAPTSGEAKELVEPA